MLSRTIPVLLYLSLHLYSFGQTTMTVPVLPQAYVDTTYVRPTGRSVTLHQGADLQAAINAATPGDELVLDAGATWKGHFELPAKSGPGWITIRGSAMDQLPPAGKRVNPSFAGVMPKIVTNNSQSALEARAGASHYRLMGLEIAVDKSVTGVNWNVIVLKGGKDSELSSDIILDRVWLHGNARCDCIRGIVLDGRRNAVIDSYLESFQATWQDTQAILIFNGPGPYKIVNNFLSATGENIMLGGADPTVSGMIPSDLEVRHNHFYKPILDWRNKPTPSKRYDVKNLFEVKNGQRILLDGNVFEYSWEQAQQGTPIVLTPRAQCYNYNDPEKAVCKASWAVASDFTFTNNIVRHCAGVIVVAGSDPLVPKGSSFPTSHRVLIRNNLFEDINARKYGGHGWIGLLVHTYEVTIDHNTGINTGGLNPKTAYDYSEAFYIGEGKPPVTNTNLVMTNNIFRKDVSGGGNAGVASVSMYSPDAVVRNNAFVESTIKYPSDWKIETPPDWDSVGFVDFDGGDYRLSAKSRLKKAGTDGKDLGADIDAVLAATAGVVQEKSPGRNVPPVRPKDEAANPVPAQAGQ